MIFPGFRRKVLEKIISQGEISRPLKERYSKCEWPKDWNLSLVVLPLPVSILTNTQRFGWRIDTFGVLVWSEKKHRGIPIPERLIKELWSTSTAKFLRMGRWGYQSFYMKQGALDRTNMVLVQKEKRQVVIFEKNTFLVITRAHTKEMQAGV